MAADWIKMRCNLWDDPRVARLCDATDQPEAMVIGALYWLWATADQHSTDGIMPGLTLRAIDRKTGVSGFGQALCDIGWVADHPDGIRIVSFEEHNGASAKKRCLTARRVAAHKAGNAQETLDADQGNAHSVTEALAERDLDIEREVIHTHTALARDWVLPKGWGQWALTEFPDWTADTVRSVAAQFSDHWWASGGSSADWLASWRKWCRDPLTQKAVMRQAAAPTPPAAPTPTVPSDAARKTALMLAERSATSPDPPPESVRERLTKAKQAAAGASLVVVASEVAT